MEETAGGDALVFDSLYQIVYGTLNSGKLRIQGNSVAFKNNKTGNVEKLNIEDIRKALWSTTSNGYGVELLLKNGKIFRICGFANDDFAKLSKQFNSQNDEKLIQIKRDVSGRNVGQIEFDEGLMKFNISNKPAIEIPLNDVCSASVGKNEINLGFHQSDSAVVSLMEMRFYIPSHVDEDGQELADSIQEKVLMHADVIQATGDALISLPEIFCLTPRGRYSIKVYPTFIQLHGKSFDFKIPYSSILRLFVLPPPDSYQVLMVLSMDPPVRQGQTRYPFIVAQMEKSEEISSTLNIPSAVGGSDSASTFMHDLTPEKLGSYYDSTSGSIKGPLYEVFSALLKIMVGRKITIPGAFKTTNDQKCISCHHRASSGLLFPLERSFLFVHKPTVYIRFEEIVCATFSRGLQSARSFDFELSLNSGTGVSFSAIDRDHYGPLYDFISSKGIKVSSGSSNISSLTSVSAVAAFDDFDDDDDDQSNARKKRARGEDHDDSFVIDDDSDEEDEDFNPNAIPDEGDDVKDEYESNPSTSSESGDESD